jgi:fatty acid desaturase (delta-4 desaturase)
MARGQPIWGSTIDKSKAGWDVAFWVWVHYHNKYLEFADTMFMVLRKSTRQISFLHVYHHCLLVWAWFLVVRFANGGDSYFGACINSAVHVIMYSYYAARLLGIKVPWKAAITQVQMLQFVICAAQSVYVYYLGDEFYPRNLTLVQLFVMSTMLVLFGNFYMKSYGKKKIMWTVIDGVKYDVTDFLERHPGGSDMLMLAVGRDASVMFHSYHRRLNVARAMLRGMKVLEEDNDDDDAAQGGGRSRSRSPKRGKRASTPSGRRTKSDDAEVDMLEDLNHRQDSGRVLGAHSQIESDLYVTIRERVNKYFDETGYSSRGGAFMYIKSATLMTALGSAYYTAVFVYPDYALYIAPFIGVMLATVGLSIQHDANHGAFSPYPTLNRWVGLLDDLIGGSALMWRHQHNIAHHAHPNDHDLDADTISNFPLIRMNPILPVRWYLRFQHIYAPILYSLLGIAYPIGDVQGFLAKSYEHVKLHPLRLIDSFTFLLGKTVHYGLVLGLPWYVHGWKFALAFFFVMQAVGGNFLASVFAVSHNSEANDYNCDPDLDWAETQIRTSCNWSPHSTFWWLVSGGLNFQIEHHLFPGVCHVHYPAIHKIVKATCEEFELPYNSYDTYFAIYKSHLTTLYLLGHGEDHKVFHEKQLAKIHKRET